jgi:hypothetical protein
VKLEIFVVGLETPGVCQRERDHTVTSLQYVDRAVT